MDEQPTRSLPHRMLGALRRQLKTSKTPRYTLPPELRSANKSRPGEGRVLRLRRSAQALREALDGGDAARLSIHGALERTLDVQLLHQQVNSAAPRSTAVNKDHKFFLPRFSFEITPSVPSQLKEERIQHRQDDPPAYSHSRLPSYTYVDATTSAYSRKHLEPLAEHPALRPRTPSTEGTATAKKEVRRKAVPLTVMSLRPLVGARQEKLDNHPIQFAKSWCRETCT
ncbi:hypothetical protein AC578_3319 [Pseudocercospora eumusae]|uniref:Uncharacterized protein n=1 Tax=Pseudocercospora eumusae TaxID=321146 RepID=A0A139GU48_9PEZI|nr:hypothetical protein AC578_3319 [Pseudocercospora eumusae]